MSSSHPVSSSLHFRREIDPLTRQPTGRGVLTSPNYFILGHFENGHLHGHAVLTYSAPDSPRDGEEKRFRTRSAAGVWEYGLPKPGVEFVLRSDDGSVYVGPIKIVDERTMQIVPDTKDSEGFGMLRQCDDTIFVGEFRDGCGVGKGVEWVRDEITLCGEFQGEMLSGIGSLEYSDGTTMLGRWKDGVCEGVCRISFSNGDTYQGNVTHGVVSGWGKMTYSDGRRYDGHWRLKQHHGMGMLRWKDGEQQNVYKGSFENGLFSGFGVRESRIEYYAGEWRDGKRHGFGEHCLKDQQKLFVGTWRNDQPVVDEVDLAYELEMSKRYYLQAVVRKQSQTSADGEALPSRERRRDALVLTAVDRAKTSVVGSRLNPEEVALFLAAPKRGSRDQQFTFENGILRLVSDPEMVVTYLYSQGIIGPYSEKLLFSSNQTWLFDGDCFRTPYDSDYLLDVKRFGRRRIHSGKEQLVVHDGLEGGVITGWRLVRADMFPIALCSSKRVFIRSLCFGSLFLSPTKIDQNWTVRVRPYEAEGNQRWLFTRGHFVAEKLGLELVQDETAERAMLILRPLSLEDGSGGWVFDGTVLVWKAKLVLSAAGDGKVSLVVWRSPSSQTEEQWWDFVNA